MNDIDSSWKGFKTTVSRTKSTYEKVENPPEISIVIEGDDKVEEYDPDSLPTSEAIKQIFKGSTSLKAFIYVGERLKHKQTILEKEVIPQNQPIAQTQDSNSVYSAIESLTQQMKMMMASADEINKLRTEMLKDSFTQQLNSTKKMYDDRDVIMSGLLAKEMDVKIREIEINSKKKSEILESVVMGIGSGLKEIITWAKDNPGDAAEIFAFLKSKPVA